MNWGRSYFNQNGTYTLTTGITLKSKITLIGEDPETTIIDANSTNSGISANGTRGEYSWNYSHYQWICGSSGSGTTWVGNVTTADKIVIDG